MRNNNIIPVILCGGSGSRLWPLSRQSFPKQFLPIMLKGDDTLLQSTHKRLKGLINISDPMIICNEEHRFIAAEQLREINVQPKDIFLEPCGRNTAPAITIAALKAIEKGEDPFLLVLASDHSIKDLKEFVSIITMGIKYANDGKLVSFGIIPESPETGYGYIECLNQFSKENKKGIPIKKFIEKPNIEKAKKFIKDKRFLWNSGMFLFKASVILKELNNFNPEIVDFCEKSLNKSKVDLDFIRLEKKSFEKCPDMSIDNGVMEKTNLGIVIPLDVGWSDIGSWKSLWEYEEKDIEGNVIIGNVIAKDTINSYLRGEERLVVGLGIKDLIIVDTKDAVLICDKKYDQKIKDIVNLLKKEGYEEGVNHKKVYRPWGNFISLAEDENWKVKRIEVKKGASLSLQLHNQRSEHWVVVKGTAIAQLDKKEIVLKENQSIYIPSGSKHRLSNNSKKPLVIIEVQCGSYLGEDDIIRFNDIYGRL
tara:strand:+ start:1279 stop:2715 length:1437 start_codon:yes stop_codon:yes gene_type:complete